MPPFFLYPTRRTPKCLADANQLMTHQQHVDFLCFECARRARAAVRDAMRGGRQVREGLLQQHMAVCPLRQQQPVAKGPPSKCADSALQAAGVLWRCRGGAILGHPPVDIGCGACCRSRSLRGALGLFEHMRQHLSCSREAYTSHLFCLTLTFCGAAQCGTL